MSDALVFPVRIVDGLCGTGVIAAIDLDPGTWVAQFDGPTVAGYDQVPEAEIRHAIGLYEGEWLIPRTDARYLNHSCDPNCRIGEDLEVVTVRPVSAGEELTISYNRADPGEYATHPENYFWDPRWNFPCGCGAPGCVGAIDRYVVGSSGLS